MVKNCRRGETFPWKGFPPPTPSKIFYGLEKNMETLFAGIDIGSRSIELVLHNGERVLESRRLPTTFDPASQCRLLFDGDRPKKVVATGYGRGLMERLAPELDLGAEVDSITEIKAHALGAFHLFPEARTVLDIGGQDTKAIALFPGGKVGKFEMNDRCAAGTGKFLEYTAGVFQIPVERFGDYALEGDTAPKINSMCTVFAETEATSLMAQGIKPQNIALGLHEAIVNRTVNMLGRVGLTWPLVFAGGVAHNPCVRSLLAKKLGTGADKQLLVPNEPDMNGALGAALWAARE